MIALICQNCFTSLLKRQASVPIGLLFYKRAKNKKQNKNKKKKTKKNKKKKKNKKTKKNKQKKQKNNSDSFVSTWKGF